MQDPGFQCLPRVLFGKRRISGKESEVTAIKGIRFNSLNQGDLIVHRRQLSLGILIIVKQA